jgi:hypothetical protein
MEEILKCSGTQQGKIKKGSFLLGFLKNSHGCGMITSFFV